MVSSCLKIITCGSDSAAADKNELDRTESKGSPDKRGWSFRKKSTSQRAQSNNTIPDTSSTGNKQHPEPNFSKPAVSEKISVLQWQEEVTPLSTEVSKTSVSEKISALQLPDEGTTFSTEVSKLDAPDIISVLQLPDQVTPLSIEVNKLDVPEKISELQIPDEMTPLSTKLSSNIPDATENTIEIDPVVSAKDSDTNDSSTTLVNFIKVDLNNLNEPVAVVLQSAIRGYLAKRAFLKLKNVVKLQAAVRGLLVRRQAVGSLLCVQAIVKMQALVRARRARSLEGSVVEEQLEEKREKSYETPLIEENSGTKVKTNYSYAQKLLYNGFARQLLESAPKKKQIRIKCDPSRPDSSWKWFDRWTTVSSSKYAQPQKPEFRSGDEEKIDITASEVGTEIPAKIISQSADLRSPIKKTTMPIDVEGILINYQANSFDFQVSQISTEEHETSLKIDVNQTEMQLDASSQTMSDSISYEPDAECEQLKPSLRSAESDSTETEDKKMFGSKKACNPAFIAAKSKFEDLSLRTISGRSINQDNGLDMKLDSPSFPANAAARTKENSSTENSIPCDPRVYAWGSECGAELSISSTLDSPDRAEVGVGKFDIESKVAEKVDSNLNGDADIAPNRGNLDVYAKNNVISQLVSPCPVSAVLHPKVEQANKETSVDSVKAEETPSEEHKPERTSSDVQDQVDATTNHEPHRASLDGSPGNNITASELNKTPTSKVTLKPKKTNVEKGSPKTKNSQSAGKKSRSNTSPNSGARNSTEQLPKDTKNGKKRLSLGSARPDHVELEPTSSISSSNSVPSYMQATQSARAKAHVNNSPRSRSDVQDKDIYIKKRHSLPTNEKQGSPRVDSSTSQRQLGANGNHITP